MLEMTLPSRSDQDPFTRLGDKLARERAAVLEHPMYARVADIAALRTFMATHVFAVWDFMSLLKSLQRRLTCTTVPWVPAPDATHARLINEIVLGEETDEVVPGRFVSHFELYLTAMAEVGADARPVLALVDALRAGQTVEQAIAAPAIPEAARRFVLATLRMESEGRTHEIAAAFLLGREDLVPAMFRRLLAHLESDLGRACPSFRIYLERHVVLDEQEHGPRARRLLAGLCGDDAAAWEQARAAACTALRARARLWDGIVEQMDRAAAPVS